MKKHTLLPLVVLLGSVVSIHAQATTATTTPVGYYTTPLKPNTFSMFGLNLHGQPLAAGVIDTASGTTLTDNEVDFNTVLTVGQTYTIELTNGGLNEGQYTTLSSWGAPANGTIVTTADLSAMITAGTTTYCIRKVATVADVFGATNSVGLTPTDDFTPDEADQIWIPQADGSFVQVIYYDDGSTAGWFDVAGNSADGYLLDYTKGAYVKRVVGADIGLVVTGEVKTSKTVFQVPSSLSFIYASSIYPAGITLGDSGLSNYVLASSDFNVDACDLVWVPQDDGSYLQCLYYDDGSLQGWYDVASNPQDDLSLTTSVDNPDPSPDVLRSAFLIQRRDPAGYAVQMNAPIIP